MLLKIYSPKIVWPLLTFLLTPITQAADCNPAFDWATRTGPIDPKDVQHKMRCMEVASKQKIPSSLCIVMGTAKPGTETIYGSGLLTAVFSEDPSTKALQGFWYPRRERTSVVLDEVLVSTNDFGSSILHKVWKEPSRSTLEKINIHYSDKSLVYQKSSRANFKANLKLIESKIFDCNQDEVIANEEKPTNKNKKTGKPIRGTKK